jgi:hypothetical protein
MTESSHDLPKELQKFQAEMRLRAQDLETMQSLHDLVADNPALFSPHELEQLQVHIEACRKRQSEQELALEVRVHCWREHVVGAQNKINERMKLLEAFDMRTGLLKSNESLMNLFVAGQVDMQRKVDEFVAVLSQAEQGTAGG